MNVRGVFLVCAMAVALAALQASADAEVREGVLIAIAREENVSIAGAWEPALGWINADSVMQARGRESIDGDDFIVVDLAGESRTARLTSNEYVEEMQYWWGTLERYRAFRSLDFEKPANRLALSGVMNDPGVRMPKIQSNSLPIYRSAVAAEIKKAGVNVRQARIVQSLRVDLDGDGREEVLLNALSRNDLGNRPVIRRGDYAGVFIRFIDGANVVTKAIELEAWPKGEEFAAPSEFEIIAVRDIDGDGKLEIVIHGRYYEGDFVIVCTFDGRKVTKVLEYGWGV